MRKLASIKEIGTILPIENADAIELAMIDGWQCVVAKKDNFKPGNKIVYIEIDSIVPERPEFEFLRDRKFRVKTIKLRGQISQGLVLPLSILPDRKKPYEIGEDVTEILGIKKYDPQAEQEKKLIVHKKQNKFQKFMMHFKWYRKLVLKKEPTAPFPEDIHKTDEERIQNLSKPFEQWKKQGIKFQGTEKIEGQSGTFFTTKLNKKHLFGVCSRNIWLKAKDKSSYWQIAEAKNFNNMLEDIAARFNATKIVLQGEIIGPNIQKNIYHLDDYDIFSDYG